MTSSQSPRNFYVAGDVYLRVRYSVYIGGRNILIWTDFDDDDKMMIIPFYSHMISASAG